MAAVPLAAFVLMSAATRVVEPKLPEASPPSTHAALVWANRVFTSRAEFSAWLSARGATYEQWSKSHPGAAPWDAPVRAEAPSPRHHAGRSHGLVYALLALAAGLTALLAVLVQRSRSTRRVRVRRARAGRRTSTARARAAMAAAAHRRLGPGIAVGTRRRAPSAPRTKATTIVSAASARVGALSSLRIRRRPPASSPIPRYGSSLVRTSIGYVGVGALSVAAGAVIALLAH
jgi:hypothetical protein